MRRHVKRSPNRVLTLSRRRRPIRVVIADDHELFLTGIEALLERRGFAVVGVARDGARAVEVIRATRPDVAVLDVAMPRLDGPDVIRALIGRSLTPAVVLVTAGNDPGLVLEGLALGVCGFVEKAAAPSELFDAIRAAARGATYLSAGHEPVVRCLPAAAGARRKGSLSPREREVLRHIAEGKTTKQVAAALGVTAKTAETHRMRVMKKLDIHDVAGLVRYAIRERIASA